MEPEEGPAADTAADNRPVHDNNGLQNGSAAAPQQQHTQQQGVQSPFATAGNWQRAKDAVQRHVGLSKAFDTLRDMQAADVIRPDQLTTIKVLGQGAFARVDSCM